ncbi:Abi family protein [Pectobacterium versatile]|uniref:Abi family protein n=1 Tax=Pectobacterium versatile TaxID=2488639 RepID=UPI0032EB2FA5
MPYVPYSKPYKKPSDLVTDLKAKNLSFKAPIAAESLLSQISYYHFKIYLYPLIDQSSPGKKFYRTGVHFESGVELYRFDEELRVLLFRIIARIEVKLRSRLDHKISELSNSPFWYLQNEWFYTPNNNTSIIDSIRSRIGSDFNRESELYAKNFRSKYYNETHDIYKNLPPFWIASELISLGQIYKIYSSLDFSYFSSLPSPSNSLLNDLSNEFGCNDFKTLVKWIRGIRDVRNRCAHHSRLWNAKLAALAGVPSLLVYAPTKLNRPYGTIVAMWQMVKALGITGINLRGELLTLIKNYPEISNHLDDMGFPIKWDQDPFW